MNALAWCDDFSFEEKITPSSVQFTVTLNDKHSKSERVVFNKNIPTPLAILLFITIIPVLVVFLSLSLIFWVLSLFKNESAELSYEEAKEYLSSGKSYLNRLSEKDKKALILKKENAPLGL
ncbi:hypothetical protein KFZ76_20580 [Methylovulum psychrotolerans]|uniref:hypothetical protein n=1 Tax=Methylovulum psychrotolerans TaxID=1704499 RepID=UPI001BFFAF97|nr:hypothetical protein [Methylovulum psychrotolerans]MBT9100103.1 hypothetical protein [Methylovulum psychrotolerans]